MLLSHYNVNAPLLQYSNNTNNNDNNKKPSCSQGDSLSFPTIYF